MIGLHKYCVLLCVILCIVVESAVDRFGVEEANVDVDTNIRENNCTAKKFWGGEAHAGD
jgi:hypothetical protein